MIIKHTFVCSLVASLELNFVTSPNFQVLMFLYLNLFVEDAGRG
jgi:hypothetical protein